MVKILIKDGELMDRALKRFKRKVEQAGVLKEIKKREFYIKPSIKKKLKIKKAEARVRKREKRLSQKKNF